ncbi:MAG TPA: hypothetical protein VK470_03990 [Bacteroidota bacterium]|nr:hypothetical protein [Bacteroidota bacterium]
MKSKAEDLPPSIVMWLREIFEMTAGAIHTWIGYPPVAPFGCTVKLLNDVFDLFTLIAHSVAEVPVASMITPASDWPVIDISWFRLNVDVIGYVPFASVSASPSTAAATAAGSAS